MSIHVAIRHTTVYTFDRRVTLSPHVVRLRPAPHSRTPILAYTLKITPEKHFINWQQDPFGNYLARLVFPEATREFSVDVEVIADLTVINPFDYFVEDSAEHWPFDYDVALKRELTPYLETEPAGPLLQAWLVAVPRERVQCNNFLVALNQRLQGDIAYTVRMEPGVQTPEETLEKALGSCRDSAWLLVQILRHLGLAARFVSGYLVQLTADEKSLDGPSGTDNDFTDLHAWTEVYLPGAGWIGLDPTSGLFAGEGHIPLAATPQPSSAAPIEGMTDPCEVEFAFSNTVTRIREDPRVTLPYSDAEWEAILALGTAVDDKLLASDVRLTHGGEPTFVSIDDMEAPEWNTDAFGMHKRERAEVLARRLRDRLAPGSLLHTGQGKWYPGEPLPRWALGIYWRKDGVPVWQNPALLAEAEHNAGRSVLDARHFAKTLAQHLGLAMRYAQPVYEDALAALLQEAELPPNVDVLSKDGGHAALDSASLRGSLANKLSRGLNTPAGYVLPLAWRGSEADGAEHPWHSAPWHTRRDRLYLAPGDAPIGLRLPLNSLPWVAEDEREPWVEVDPFAAQPPLADFHGEIAARFSRYTPAPSGTDDPEHPELHPQTASAKLNVAVPHTALCVEARGGCLFVFMPPTTTLEHYLDLLAAVEASAAAHNFPLVIEGYAPPSDGRIEKLLVTPDPGVIEVNIHPAHNWQQLVETTTLVYEEARLSRLAAEKFMLDGRHAGTGGGNHVTLGGATPSDSPFLRRPDLLASLITYWQHHPALSYLFSGLFIGPTSQAPRVDEGRVERLYELEIAFQQMPIGDTPQPWLVDRLLRNLLTDLTGNTHRSEFCIDKLYSPDSASGRLGLLEFRGFEMPPHARMSLAQMLLLRALVVRFWDQPYRKPLVRWGTLLHDRYMLPHYLWADLKDVVDDLNAAGFAFDLDWYKPFLEFRFPRHGTLQIGDIAIELRTAIEPWNVLGEESTSLGTARYVDSSVERLQVKLNGLTDSRYVLACNGQRVPLVPTGVHGEFICGVRYRAWQPPSALHPTIGIHSPLVFDLIDTWNDRAVGGCTYRVVHPGGRSYETFPVNAMEAESRRHTRFQDWGHSIGSFSHPPSTSPMPATQSSAQAVRSFIPDGSAPGPMAPPAAAAVGEFPHTLDLRRR
ncbi:MAG: transglutaminase family protein [Thiobacillus sp.]|nr:transglutaminase family protein [Thiobacillus sp.]